MLIAEGPHVKALQLTDAPLDSSSDEAANGEQPPSVEFGGFMWKVLASKEADEARGIGNIRRALVLDSTYDWRTVQAPTSPIGNTRLSSTTTDCGRPCYSISIRVEWH